MMLETSWSRYETEPLTGSSTQARFFFFCDSVSRKSCVRAQQRTASKVVVCA